MAQDIIIRTYCDVCLANDHERHDAQTYTLGDGPVLLDIDLCAEHAKPLGDLVAHARPSARQTAATGPNPCPECGRQFKTVRGLNRHRAESHGEQPADGERVTGLHGCDAPGCGRGFPSKQGLAMHRYRAHGIRSESTGAERKRAARESA